VPYDPALTAIAVATNDALTDHVWRYDTATADAGDPVAHIAVALCRAAADFNTTSDLLTRLLTQLRDETNRYLRAVIDFTSVVPNCVDIDAFRVQQYLERFHSYREAMLSLYAVWRRHRPTSRDPRTRHLLPNPYDPTKGMVTLNTEHDRLAWHVTPDVTAAAAYGLHGYGDTVGEIRLGDSGWQPTAFTNPADSDRSTNSPQLVYPLPPADTEATACRALLRWCAARDDERRHERHPAQLTTAELAYGRPTELR
jgi:hypothetical protein